MIILGIIFYFLSKISPNDGSSFHVKNYETMSAFVKVIQRKLWMWLLFSGNGVGYTISCNVADLRCEVVGRSVRLLDAVVRHVSVH